MTGQTFERIRIGLALALVVVAAVVLWPSGAPGDADRPDGSKASDAARVVVGVPGGAVLSTPSPTLAPTPAVTASVAPSSPPSSPPTASPAPPATPSPAPDTFSARVMACRDIDGPRCRGEFDEFPRRTREFVALVLFSDARAGDTISVSLLGPGIVIEGGPYTLGGGGDGYYYSRITHGKLPEGDYALVAYRNGVEVARTRLEND